jgi:hypothetical protein
MSDDPRRSAAASGGAPSMAEVVDVLRPQVEKIAEGFQAIRMMLDGLAEHLSRQPAAPAVTPAAERPVRRAPAATREPPEEHRSPPTAKASAPAAVAPEPPPLPPPSAPELPPLPAELPPMPVAVRVPAAVPVSAPASAPAATPPAPARASPTPVRAAPAPTAIPVTGGGGAGNWSSIIFGADTASNPAVAHLSGRLLSEVYGGDDDAMGMVGQLMDFRSADRERKLRMLKDIGEAFYRWKPAGDDRLRDALIAWVHALLDREGIPNRITVVQVGDRYDMQAHNAKERGIEVSAVYGWVVLRDNGKVYSKANVSVR